MTGNDMAHDRDDIGAATQASAIHEGELELIRKELTKALDMYTTILSDRRLQIPIEGPGSHRQDLVELRMAWDKNQKLQAELESARVEIADRADSEASLLHWNEELSHQCDKNEETIGDLQKKLARLRDVELRHAEAILQIDTLNTTLGHVHAECTRLLEENRKLKQDLAHEREDRDLWRGSR